jgi:ketosteroid isomerase-like protein
VRPRGQGCESRQNKAELGFDASAAAREESQRVAALEGQTSDADRAAAHWTDDAHLFPTPRAHEAGRR